MSIKDCPHCVNGIVPMTMNRSCKHCTPMMGATPPTAPEAAPAAQQMTKDDRRPIPEHHSANFETLKRAFADDSVALMTCGSKLGTRTVICMVNRNTDGSMTFIPVGEMCEAENPFQHYTPPFPGEEDGS